MLIAHYTGDHAHDALSVRIGWWLTRLVQKGEFGRITHCEAILAGDCSSAVIASASVRDGGVRTKHGVKLDPAHWLIADVPQWRTSDAAQWFAEHDREPYDWRGAWATVMPGHFGKGWDCNASVGASGGLKTPRAFTPALFAAITFSFGRAVTAQFFNTTP